MPMSWELTEAFNILINNHKSSANIATVMSFIKLVRAFLWEQHVFFFHVILVMQKDLPVNIYL